MNGKPWIKMMKVNSSSLSAIGYDKQEKELYVRFQNGGLYRYKRVSVYKMKELLQAESIGSYFNRSIKAHHPFEIVHINETNEQWLQ